MKKDYYLGEINCFRRLQDEYKKYGKLIIAVDWDDTLYNYHKVKGRTYNDVINLLRRWKEKAQIIIFTGAGIERFEEIENYCIKENIPYHGINCDSSIKTGGRKLYANVYLDDRAGLPLVYSHLVAIIEKIEKGKL